MARYQIFDDAGALVNTILADPAFVEEQYPGHYKLLPDDPKIAQRIAIQIQLEAIDTATNKARTFREMQLGNADTLAWLKAQDAQAATLRAQLKGLA